MAILRRPAAEADAGRLRDALEAELAERVEQLRNGGRHVLEDGTFFQHPAPAWLAALRAGRPVEVPVFYVRAAAHRAGLPPPPDLPASGSYTIT